MPVIPPREALREVAILALVQVAQDPNAAPAARAAAARTLLESLGDIGRLQEIARRTEKPLSELSLREIDAEIGRLAPRSGRSGRLPPPPVGKLARKKAGADR